MMKEFFANKLDEKRKNGNLRYLKKNCLKSQYINFSSNDYLGLSTHPSLIANAQQFSQLYGVGSTGSRLVCGDFPIAHQLESELAQLVQRESSLLFATGFQANLTLIPSLADRETTIFIDRLAHHSLIQGALLSSAHVIRYQHNSISHLKKCILSCKTPRKLIVSESLFSMDGDLADLETLQNIAKENDALLYIDDAHAIGTHGEQGEGLAAKYSGIDFIVGTFGKAFGGFGAFIACSEFFKNYFLNFCGGVIYTTALPPSVIASNLAAAQLIPKLKQERIHLKELGTYFRSEIQKIGLNVPNTATEHIIPLILGCSTKTTNWSEILEKKYGIYVGAIRPPTVPAMSARLRFSISSNHTYEDIDRLIYALHILASDA